ncbi:conjugal transfer protein TrbL family protein [Halobacillus amylolyticus]|uniref:Conjugal transfer protein TraL n=1 Tax=Halobacillus amylolyticus TaxID=2932259 RepID=A0ABY4HGR5_9BACI|nr:conjugal transfer protein TrbL family protein [Halobacillus amylolyticus]UOR14079.1 hypothetical protein MUO15_21220 [Halobacillus amylolyticus]
MAKRVFIISIFIVIGAFVITNSSVFAEPGGFYDDVIEQYKQETGNTGRKVEHLKSYMKDIGLDKYNYSSNTFDCAWYDVTCHVSGAFLFSNMVGLVKAGVDQISDIVKTPKNITTDADNLWFMYGFETLSWTMASIFLLYHAMKITVLYMGQAEEGMNILQEKLWQLLAGGILLGVYTKFFEWVMELQRYIAEALGESVVSGKDIAIALAVNSPAYGIVLSLFLAVILIVFAIAYLYRYALFTLLFITGVIAIPTIVNDTYNFFNIWLKTLISNVLTFSLQTLCYALGFKQLVSLEQGAMLYGIAFFILALSVPSLLNQFGGSTGSGRAVSSGVKNVVRYAGRR